MIPAMHFDNWLPYIPLAIPIFSLAAILYVLWVM
jgi:hypothetical protein